MRPNIKKLCHNHIDGSIAMLDVIPDLYKQKRLRFPFSSKAEWQNYCRNSEIDLVQRFKIITEVLQDHVSLWRAAWNYARVRSEQGYTHVEAKFAPQYHLKNGMTLKNVARAFCSGLNDATTNFGIITTPVICIGRETSPEEGKEVARVAIDLCDELKKEIILDLACVEPGNPPEKHLPAYKMTFGTPVKRDCHAGEWVERRIPDKARNYFRRLSDNVRTAITSLKCHSIGHAIPMGRNEDLINMAIDNNVRVVGCPLSQLDLGNIESLRDLKIDHMLKRGVRWTMD